MKNLTYSTASAIPSVPRRLSHAKLDLDFREASRRQDAKKLRAAFDGRTQAEISVKGSRALGVSPRQIINWMQCENDMPSWAVKAVDHYLQRLEHFARRIEGGQ